MVISHSLPVLLNSLCFILSVGVEEKLDYLNQMKVKGLVLGPIHTVQADQPSTLELNSINPEFGSESQLISLLERAHRKGDLAWLFLRLSKDNINLVTYPVTSYEITKWVTGSTLSFKLQLLCFRGRLSEIAVSCQFILLTSCLFS